jgi:hypothetical protein
MKCIVAVLAVPALLIAFVSCGGKSQEDAGTVLQQAHTAMRALDSYRATVTTSGESVAGADLAIEYAWAAPNSFRSLTPIVSVEGTGTCGAHKAGQPRRSGCTEVRGETLQGYVEAVLIGERQYTRSCQGKGSQCDEWEVRDAGTLSIMGITYGQAEWTITALTMVQEGEVVGEESVGGEPVIRLKGALDVAEVQVSTLRRAAASAGIETVGEECVEQESTPVPEGVTPEAIPTPQCRPVTVEDFLSQVRDAIEHDIGSAEMWIGREDHLVRRFALSVPPADPNGAGLETIVEFSRFNDVVIEPPR